MNTLNTTTTAAWQSTLDGTTQRDKSGRTTRRTGVRGGDWFGCGRTITNESWEKFKAARADYYQRVDKAEAAGAPNDPLLGHPKPPASIRTADHTTRLAQRDPTTK